MRIVDVHSHMLPPSYLALMDQVGFDPLATEGFPTPVWSADKELAFVEETGIDYAVLTLSSPHLHFGDDGQACRAARAINEDFADLCRDHPDRFGFCAALPTPCVEGSLAEAEYALDSLGALGVKVPSNSRGIYLGDPSLEPLFEFLNDRQAPLIIHPVAPQEVPAACFTAGPKPLFEFICDTTRTVLDLVTKGRLEKYPQVKVVVPHAGSFLPLIAARLAGISTILAPKGLMEPVDVAANMASLYFDIAGDVLPTWLDALLKIADPKKIMYGSDFPYTPVEKIVAQNKVLFASDLIAPIKEDVLHGNADRLFCL